MRKRLWFSSFAVAMVAVLVVGVPALVFDVGRGAALGVIAAVMAVAAALAGWLTAVLAGRLARPVDPRPLGRRYGAADLDQVADGLDTSARRLSSLLAADRELTADASHQLRTPLTALSMRLEEMIAAADDPDVVREEGSAALAQGRDQAATGYPNVTLHIEALSNCGSRRPNLTHPRYRPSGQARIRLGWYADHALIGGSRPRRRA